MTVLHEVLCRALRPFTAPPRHSLDHPRPDQRPAAALDPDQSDDDWSDDDAAFLDDVLAPPLVAWHRTVTVPTAPVPVIAQDGWPYNLRSV